MAHPTILAFDTSGPWVETAVLRGSKICAARSVDMATGQAERLMPLIEETLAEAQVELKQLDAIGVGIGPGNFTGIRISVAAARGLALALARPAIGVSMLDALAFHAPRPCLALLSAPRDMAYLQRFGADVACAATMISKAELHQWVTPGITLVGDGVAEHAEPLGLPHAPAACAPACAIAHLAAERLGTGQTRPAPLYIKPADAAPSREKGPVIL
ncbi:tRNA (adenosine(37)-N6)-threonylcarbamoyltransferase complex dimerization subunit type 1 TsaB [Gymnodinialimonas ceratoperidinii]|uniref:tRNA (Adenosine(37)-N6)-threonylcarbamoyltransferase complex dimerization subunit type 1 TsaB n=1 Tax=Gymnodinialimonas ceratoperidinii TaxID=2856823 RepID=A0A8F6TYY0_9RHOB|nr:tRNA (adenosine(37)-N6)-threonylcarbamoyltransferase complex dimerization subunit type 1 TsaB [Gymnodinialimonas ceratoperidinii]QXT40503.1 tRNA (adenosine(37)-N6)-threonylcarbamoyltransferase complex dimerization subunit type 1 TsaB [Gymnodinialimonas ceratoperidinii]